MIRSLVAELRADAGSAMLPIALSTGVIAAVIVLVGEVAIASIIFSGPLSPLVPRGTGAILFGTLVMCFLTALTCTYKGTISVPHFAPAAVLLTVGGAVASVMVSASSEAVFATMIVIVGLSTLATAICYLLIGRFRLAYLFRFMPYPLVGGFLAGCGWFLAKSSVAVASGITMTWETLPTLAEIETIQKWAPGVVLGVLLLVVTKVRPHYLILPSSAVLAVGICHATLFALDISLAEATAAGILFEGILAESAWPPIGLNDLALVDWGVVTSQLPGILAVMLVALISLVFHAGGLELISGVEIDLNREFRAEGVSSLLAGLGGSSPGCNSIPNSAISHATGAETRLTGITVALIVGLILFVGGDVLALLPTSVLAGLVLFVRAQPALRLADRQPQNAAVAGLRHRPRGLARHRRRRVSGRRGRRSRGGRGLLRRVLQQGECRRRRLHPCASIAARGPVPPPIAPFSTIRVSGCGSIGCAATSSSATPPPSATV